MLTNAKHQEIVDNLRSHYEDRLTRQEIYAERNRKEANKRENDIVSRANQAINDLITDLNKLSAEVVELREHKRSSERVIERLRDSNRELAARVNGGAEVVAALEDAVEARQRAEYDLKVYQEREKNARKKAAKEREAEVKAARQARKLAAENGEQWAVEAILNPPKLGLFS